MRDDIVIRPRLKQPAQASTRAIEDRAMRAQGRTRERQSLLARVARVRLAMRAAVALRARQASSLAGDAFSILSPTKKLAAAAVAAGAGALIARKLETGKSFRLLADEFVESVYGDLDEQAAAAAEARASLPPAWRGIINRNGDVVPAAIQRVYDINYERALARRRGETQIRLNPAFDSQETLDHVMVTAADGVRKAGAYLKSLVGIGGDAK